MKKIKKYSKYIEFLDKLKNKIIKEPKKNNFFSYFLEDLRSIVNNKASITVLLALIIMPWFYAWFNISASWNPYSNTENIKIAVVNNDTWTNFAEKNINVWEKVIENLKENHAMWWNFVDEKEAKFWVLEWKYYASILIPENFSKNMLSFLSDNPEKPEIIYTVNEKLNAIAPNITKKWVEAISSSIEANFIGSIYEEAFKKANKTAEKIQNHQKDLAKARKITNELTKKLPETRKNLEKWKEAIWKWKQTINTINQTIPELEKVLTKINNSNINLPIDEIINTSEDFIKNQVKLVWLLINDSIAFAKVWDKKIDELNDKMLPLMQKAQKKFIKADYILWNINRFLTKIQKITNSKILQVIINKNQNLRDNIWKYMEINNKIYYALERWDKISDTLIEELENISKKTSESYNSFSDTVNNSIKPAFEELRSYLRDLSKQIKANSEKILKEIPKLQNEITRVNSLLDKWDSKINDLLNDWNKIENTVKTISNVLNNISDERLNEILRIMLLNPDSEENFFKYPIKVKTETLFPSPNYGSSIAPFFTTLALWVWALLSVSMLSVYNKRALKEENYRNWYVWRLMLFLSIWILQAYVVVLWNIIFFKIHVVHSFLLLFSAIFIIILFQIFVFSLVFLFWNAWKVLAILILLLQLSAWSWTFPVELTNNFFVKVHPYLPFTYAIDLLREASFWIVETVLWKNIKILFSMIIIIFSISFILAPYLSKIFIKMDARTKWMDIFH